MKIILPFCPVLSINTFSLNIYIYYLQKNLLSWEVRIYHISWRHLQVNSNPHETKNRI
jgi:hypothetical protein